MQDPRGKKNAVLSFSSSQTTPFSLSSQPLSLPRPISLLRGACATGCPLGRGINVMKTLNVSSTSAGVSLTVRAEEEEEEEESCCKPVPSVAICVLIPLFVLGFSVSIFILILVHNALFFLSLLFLLALVLSFIFWNILSHHRSKRAPIFAFLQSFPPSDLVVALDGQLVKISGLASCGSVSLESSYEKASKCIYSSTSLYEHSRFSIMTRNLNTKCFESSLAFCERLSTDFYITDSKSGSRVMVKAGSGCKVIPFVKESCLVNTTKQCRPVSSSLTKWLQDRNLSTEPRPLLLKEGYVQEGDPVTVIGKLHKNNGVLMIVQPGDVISTGCIWKKLLLPVEADGLILAA